MIPGRPAAHSFAGRPRPRLAGNPGGAAFSQTSGKRHRDSHAGQGVFPQTCRLSPCHPVITTKLTDSHLTLGPHRGQTLEQRPYNLILWLPEEPTHGLLKEEACVCACVTLEPCPGFGGRWGSTLFTLQTAYLLGWPLPHLKPLLPLGQSTILMSSFLGSRVV